MARRPLILLLKLCVLGLISTKAHGQVAAARAIAGQTRSSPKILLIGDSLTVGPFGAEWHDLLVRTYGHRSVAVYGSCGSSPEHWLGGQPRFISHCGYREQTPQTERVFENGGHRRPPPIATPDLHEIVRRFRPTVVIVQLGTNWMDDLVNGLKDKEPEYRSILDRFIQAVRSEPEVSRVIWIMPPDSSRFSVHTQKIVQKLILDAADRYRFTTVNSRAVTRYVPGKTGDDGVHYNLAAGTEWADRIWRLLRPR